MAEAPEPALGPLLRHVRAALEKAGKPEARLEARLIVEHATGTRRADALIDPNRLVSQEQVRTALEMLDRRLAGEPAHRIIGARDFYGLRLSISAGTLEPRPDTEALVDLALPFVTGVCETEGTCRILDLGTGTGAIALALLAEEKRATALATDISDDALATARANADITGNAGRFRAIRSDWFAAVEGRFHIIVSNPPYIASEEIASLDQEVRQFDPVAALDGGPDGLGPYRMIAAGARRHLEEGGHVLVEVGHDQARAVEEIFTAQSFRLVKSARDLGGHERALAFTA